ncbi:hypothetical protein [Undibacterium sp. Ren11W]|uniref:hypothetical protein n=1 Tax=Undibacterium sp. Ren11W TaxID=3413045 RepID=UPI003BEF9FE4
MGRYVTATPAPGATSVIAPLIPGVPVFGSGIRQIFTSSGTFVSDGRQVRVYVIAGAGNDAASSVGAGAGAASAIVTPPSGNINIVVGAKPGGVSSFGTGAYLVDAGGGSNGSAATSGWNSGGSGTTGTLLSKGDSTGNGAKVGFYGPARSGFPSLPYGIGGGTAIEGGGVVIVEY